jgi:steroid delta-isomerase-like uncharacterized protein
MSDVLRLFKRWLSLRNSHNWPALVELYAADCEFVTPFGTRRGRSEVFEGYLGLGEAMPDSKLEILTTVAEDPLLAVEGIFTATLTGRLRAGEHTLEPTGKMCSVKFLGLYQFSDELIVSHHDYEDRLGMLSQLGVSLST